MLSVENISCHLYIHFMSLIHVYNVYTLGKGNGETVQNNRNQDQRQTR